MKKIYFTLIALFAFGMTGQAQNAAVSGCMDGDTLQIVFNESLNCSTAPGDLAGMAEIGFHSGADMWTAVVEAEKATSTTGKNNGSDMFTVRLHPVDYYGLAAAPANVYFVFNQFPATQDPATQWESEGKDEEVAGACNDFFVTMADLTACTTSDTDVELDATAVALAPNPMSGSRTSLFVDAVEVGAYNVVISNTMGQIVRVQNNLSQDVVFIERGNLTAGIYFVTVQGAKGQVSKRLVIQ